MLLKDMADSLAVKPSYISAIEHGKKGQPSREFLKKVARSLSLTRDEKQLMLEAVENSPSRITISGDKPGIYEVAAIFGKKVNNLTDQQIEGIRLILET